MIKSPFARVEAQLAIREVRGLALPFERIQHSNKDNSARELRGGHIWAGVPFHGHSADCGAGRKQNVNRYREIYIGVALPHLLDSG
jgi:hypothetical protein